MGYLSAWFDTFVLCSVWLVSQQEGVPSLEKFVCFSAHCNMGRPLRQLTSFLAALAALYVTLYLYNLKELVNCSYPQGTDDRQFRIWRQIAILSEHFLPNLAHDHDHNHDHDPDLDSKDDHEHYIDHEQEEGAKLIVMSAPFCTLAMFSSSAHCNIFQVQHDKPFYHHQHQQTIWDGCSSRASQCLHWIFQKDLYTLGGKLHTQM